MGGVRAIDIDSGWTGTFVWSDDLWAVAGIATSAAGWMYVLSDVGEGFQQLFPDGGLGHYLNRLMSNGPAITVDDSGDCYLGLSGSQLPETIVEIAPDGTTSYDAGFGVLSSWPTAMALAPDGSMYLAIPLYFDAPTGDQIWRAYRTGDFELIAGTGSAGFVDGPGGDGGIAEFNQPSALAVANDGSLVVADTKNHAIRRISFSSPPVVSTIAGGPTPGYLDGTGGPHGVARFDTPVGVVIDLVGDIYVSDQGNSAVRRIDTGGNVTTVAGGIHGHSDTQGLPTSVAQFNQPFGVTTDELGNVYSVDGSGLEIRRLERNGQVSVFAGSGIVGNVDGDASAAMFGRIDAIVATPWGRVYVADTGNNAIRVVDPSGNVSTLAGSGEAGFADGTGLSARFSEPQGLTVAPDGSVLVADTLNHRIRRIDPRGEVTTLAGSGQFGSADGLGTTAEFETPSSISSDSVGNAYVIDQGLGRVRTITSAGNVATLPGNVGSALGLAVDPGGNIYFVNDSLDFPSRLVIQLLPDGGTPILFVDAGFSAGGIAADACGDLIVADTGNNCLRLARP